MGNRKLYAVNRFGYLSFRNFLRNNGYKNVIIKTHSISRIPGLGGSDGVWIFEVDGIELYLVFTVYGSCETLINSFRFETLNNKESVVLLNEYCNILNIVNETDKYGINFIEKGER